MTEQKQSMLLKLAGLFLTLFAIILSLSPSVRERSWDVAYRWQHWAGLLAWVAVFAFAHRETKRHLPEHDPYLLPIAALLTGWGLLTIWRLTPEFGLRQTIWMAATVGLFAFSLRFPLDLEVVRRYKYLLLTGGLLLTSLTLIFGSNPAGTGPRLWLGCCGIYLQPSEPLKLLLVGYLAAYLADRLPARDRLIPLLFPTLFVTGLALLLLLVQRDLGTASIFILLYATIVYLALGRKRVLLISAGMLLLAGLAGYFLIGLIQLRVDAWINPWLDPSGRSYQIVQSLLAIANGGIAGRGPGLGSPTLVPISHSDFIFTAIAEETGLVGVVGLLALLAALISRGLRVALLAPDRFQTTAGGGHHRLFQHSESSDNRWQFAGPAPDRGDAAFRLLWRFISVDILRRTAGATAYQPPNRRRTRPPAQALPILRHQRRNRPGSGRNVARHWLVGAGTRGRPAQSHRQRTPLDLGPLRAARRPARPREHAHQRDRRRNRKPDPDVSSSRTSANYWLYASRLRASRIGSLAR